MERSRSASAAHCIARSITAGRSAWPNEIVSLFRIPPPCPHGGPDSPERTRSRVACIGPFQPQERQTTVCTVPCTWITAPGRRPPFPARPSMTSVPTPPPLPPPTTTPPPPCPPYHT